MALPSFMRCNRCDMPYRLPRVAAYGDLVRGGTQWGQSSPYQSPVESRKARTLLEVRARSDVVQQLSRSHWQAKDSLQQQRAGRAQGGVDQDGARVGAERERERENYTFPATQG